MVNSEEKSFTHDELKKALIEFKVDQVDSVDSEVSVPHTTVLQYDVEPVLVADLISPMHVFWR